MEFRIGEWLAILSTKRAPVQLFDECPCMAELRTLKYFNLVCIGVPVDHHLNRVSFIIVGADGVLFEPLLTHL